MPEGGTAITNYAAPGPIAGTGPHRYAFLMFAQPESFQAPSNLSTAGTPPSHWYVENYVEETGLQLVAASFFTVSNGDATGSVAATEAVVRPPLPLAPPAPHRAFLADASYRLSQNTATLSVSSSAASSSAASSGSARSSGASPTGSQTGTTTAGAPSQSAGGSSGASSLVVSLGAGALGLVGAAAALL